MLDFSLENTREERQHAAAVPLKNQKTMKGDYSRRVSKTALTVRS